MKRYVLSIMTALFLATGLCHAWQYPPASGIKVATNSFSDMAGSGTNVQEIFDWLDDNMVFGTNAYASIAFVTAALANTTTQSFGVVKVASNPTNGHRNISSVYGFSVSSSNGASWAITNVSTNYSTITNMYLTPLFNVGNWYATNTGIFTPEIAGYYRFDVEMLGTLTNHVQVVDQNTNIILQMDGAATNQATHGTGIAYASGTASTYFWARSLTNTIQRFKFSGIYIGE